MKFLSNVRSAYLYALALVAFSIPLSYRFTLYALGLVYLLSLIGIVYQPHTLRLSKNKLSIFLVLFGLIHIISLLYSSNIEYGVSDVFQKLSFFLIPLAFIPFKLSKTEIKLSENSFLVGMLVSSVYLLIRATCRSTYLTPVGVFFMPYPVGVPWENYFFYDLLVQPHHPTYYSMYLSLAIVLFASKIRCNPGTKLKLVYISAILFLAGMIFLASSKAGILTAFIILIAILFWVLKRKGKVVASVILIGFTVVGGIFISRNERVNNLVNAVKLRNSTEIPDFDKKLIADNLVRLKIWGSTSQTLNNFRWITGVGVGDTTDELLKVYKKQNIELALNEKLNVHNQYLQTLLATGIFGLLLLLLILGYTATISIRDKNMVLLLFLVIISFNFLFESLFERVFGVIFFTFFILLFSTHSSET